MAAITVIGDALLDVQVAPARPPRPGGDVPAVVRLGPGGQGANLAVRLARRGHGVRLACAVGDDPAGSLVRDALRRDGVELIASATDATGSVVVLLDATGERGMLSDRVPLAARIEPAAVPRSAWLVVSGYLLLEPDAKSLAEALARTPARRMLAGCALDPADVDGWVARAAALRPDLLVLNADEASAVAGGPAEVAARLGAPVVVVTDRSGARAVVAGSDATVVAPSVEGSVVDATGAGDAFAAALLARLADGPWPPVSGDLESALSEAAAAGVAATRVAGAQGRIHGEAEPGMVDP